MGHIKNLMHGLYNGKMDDDAGGGAFAHRLRPRQPTKAQLEQAKARKKKELQARRELSKQKITARRRETYISALERAPEVFNPKVPIGTGFHELRGARVAYDLTTGAPGNPDGPWKQRHASPAMFHVPLPLDAFVQRAWDHEVTWIPSGHRPTVPERACLAPMVTQFTGQCYLASVLNMLLGMADVKNLMQRVFARIPSPLMDIVQHGSTIPAGVPLPLGLALLQVFYTQYGRLKLEQTPIVTVLEQRMQGRSIGKGGGGSPHATLLMVASALGLSWALTNDSSMEEPVPKTALLDIMDVRNTAQVLSPSKQGRRSAGAVITVYMSDLMGGHGYAALDCNVLFDSNMYAQPCSWRSGPLEKALLRQSTYGPTTMTGGLVVFVSPKLNSDKVADAVIRACTSSHDYMAFLVQVMYTFIHPECRTTMLTSTQLQYTKDGVLDGKRVLSFVFSDGGKLKIYAEFVLGVLNRNRALDWPDMVTTVDSTLIWFKWVWRAKGLPVEVHLNSMTREYSVEWPMSTKTGSIVAMDRHWLPPVESLPPDIVKTMPWVRDIIIAAATTAVYPVPHTKFNALL